MMMNKDDVFKYLDELFPEPKCELKYKKDYELLIAVVLSAQTTDRKVNLVTEELFKKYPTLQQLSKAELSELKKIIKIIGTFNKKAVYIIEISKILLDKFDGCVPKNFKDLESLPGVGHKTASVVLSTLYNIPAFAVDTHVSRVAKRLGFAENNDDVKIVESKLKKILPEYKWGRTHHQLVLFGRYKCKAIKPECSNCKLKNICKM